MVVIADGRFELPEKFSYSKNYHVYLDKEKKLVGLDQIGYAFLKNPTEMKILVEKEVKINEPFAVITTDQGITTLYSPCSGKIKKTNTNALKWMEGDAYKKGYIIELEDITDIDANLVTGGEIEHWAMHEVRSLLHGYYIFKIIEIGDSTTGKTAIKVRFTDDFFKKDLKTTLGVDFGSKEIKCEFHGSDPLFNGTYRFTAKMNVWDAAGQAHYGQIRGLYYRGAKGAILAFDVNNPVSFDNLHIWVEEMEENIGRKVPVLLIGNKIDLERKVPREKAEAYAKEHGFQYFECSAKTGEGVNKAFENLAIEMYKYEEKIYRED